MSRNQRKIKNFLIRPKFQMRVTTYFIVCILAIFGGLLAVVQKHLNDVKTILMNSNVDFATNSQINATLGDLSQFTWIIFFISAVFAVLFSIIVSHRIAGPMTAICRFIDEMIEGNYDYNRVLRPYDELLPIMDRLQKLAGKLRGDSSSKK